MGKDRGRGRRNHNSGPYNKNNWRGQKRDRPPQNEWQRNRAPQQQKSVLLENQVGITEFTNPDAPGFTGILKSRFSDFHVNEIDSEGKVLELNDLTVPKVAIERVATEDLDKWRKELEAVIGPEVWQEIADLAEAKTYSKGEQKVEIDVSTLDKEQRGQVHQLIKQLYKGKLVSTTIGQQQQVKPPPKEEQKEQQESPMEQTVQKGSPEVKTEQNESPEEQIEQKESPEVNTEKNESPVEKKTIRILKAKSGRGDKRWNFPSEFVSFLVHKTNLVTSDVASTLASRLSLRPSQVNYCGIKDKRAKTTQNFCIKRRGPDQIVTAARALRNVQIGNFAFRNTTLKLGDLKGNRFRIALRHIDKVKRGSIEVALESLRERGFINYYGLQRFGNSASVPTYEVGVALLKNDYKLACELILKPRDSDVEFMRPIREEWWEKRDSAAAAAKIYGEKFIEKKLLDGLARFGESDYSSALRQIPRNMLMLYPHAYQSLIFNRIASRRIKEFGLKLIPGDLVYVEHDQDQEENTKEVPEEEEEQKEEENAEDLPETVAEDETIEEESIFKRKVRPLTPEDIASGKFRLSDVVLPLPGHDITYPANDCGVWYDEMLAEVGLTSDLLKTKEKTYALGGAYRKMIIQPSDLKWNFRLYNTPEDTLIASDWELLKGIPITPEPADEEEAKFMALLLEFSLPSAAYATMFLRELFKQDTSAATQMQLEKQAMGITGGKATGEEPKEEPMEEEEVKKEELVVQAN